MQFTRYLSFLRGLFYYAAPCRSNCHSQSRTMSGDHRVANDKSFANFSSYVGYISVYWLLQYHCALLSARVRMMEHAWMTSTMVLTRVLVRLDSLAQTARQVPHSL